MHQQQRFDEVAARARPNRRYVAAARVMDADTDRLASFGDADDLVEE